MKNMKRLFLAAIFLVFVLLLPLHASASDNNAQFVSQSVPRGNTIYYSPKWPEISRIMLADNEQVLPGATKTFSFNATAPVSPGNYNFQWRMVKEGVEYFGNLTPNMDIKVNAAPPIPGKIMIRTVNGVPEFYESVIGSLDKDEE
ncbi:MAG: hypothetical protein NTU57_01875 [Candidatus Aenigmarchaeota archaeon]|nr:hypothetical protein [Candidatus Aenigmarchaeota archaeon]